MRQKIDVIRASAVLLAGILAGCLYHPSLRLCLALLLVFLAGGVFFYRRSRGYILDQKPVRIYRFLIYAAVFMAGMGRTAFTERPLPPGSVSRFIGQDPVSFSGSVIAPPHAAPSRTTLRVRIDKNQPDPESPNDGVLLLVLYSKTDKAFHYGDRLKISGTVILPPDTGSGFSYRSYLERSGISGLINNPRVELLPGFSGSHLKAKIFQLRSVLLEQIYRFYPKPESALLAGILLGDESQISSSVEHAFQKTGTAHIIAISGANFTVLTWMLLTILKKVIGKWWGPLLMLPFIWFYTILVGENPAVVRAAIMCGLSIFGTVVGRTGNGTNNLALAAALMGFARPSVVWDLGYQLSVMATLGILLFSQPLCNLLRKGLSVLFPKMEEAALTLVVDISNTLCLMSISAQVFTMWISAQAFGRISLISLPANFLIAPFQSLIMLGGFASLILSFIFYPLGMAAAWLIWPAPALTIRIVEHCARIRWGSEFFDLSPVRTWLIIGLILILYLCRHSLIRSFQTRNYQPYAAMLLMFMALMIWINALDRLDKKTEIDFHQTRSSMTLTVRSPENRSFVIADGISNYAAQELLEKQVLPVRIIPAAAWIDIPESWMRREFLGSGAADGLSVFYLNGSSRNENPDLPKKLLDGFSFSADGVTLRQAAFYLNKRSWLIETTDFTLLVPNGIPPERIFTRESTAGRIDLIVLGGRDDSGQWNDWKKAENRKPVLLDRAGTGNCQLFINGYNLAYR